MSYFSEKVKHAYNCYKAGLPRKKVYGVVEKGDKFLVIRCRRDSNYKYCLAGGGIEEGEDSKEAIVRECSEELNAVVEYVKTLGFIHDKSKWKMGDEEFWVDDEMEIVYTKFVRFGENKTLGVEGEFTSQDIVTEISKDEMLKTVAEFVKYGVKLQ